MPPSPSAPPVASAPFDVSAVVRQVELAFRRDGERWATRGAGFSVRHSSAGLELSAHHRPDAPLPRALAGPQRLVESAPVTMGPARLVRGAWTASSDGLAATQADDGTLWLRGEGWAEHLQNEDVGLEQSWHFERLPGEAGDLIVTVPVHGAEHRRATASGEHLMDPTTGLGFRVGHGTLVDADHRETTVPVVFEAGALVLRVPEAVLQASRFPVVLDPLISPEFDVDEPVVSVGEVVWGSGGVAVATNGAGYLVAWTASSFGGAGILAARVDANGSLLDRVPLVLPVVSDLFPHPFDSRENTPVIASNGADYLLAWLQSPRGAVRASRISAQGTVLDREPLTLVPRAFSSYPVVDHLIALAASDAGYLLAFNAEGLKFTRITSQGTVLDPQGIPLSTSDRFVSPVALASTSEAYRAVWAEYAADGGWSMRTAQVQHDGGVGLNQVLTSSGDELLRPAIAWNDGGFLATWSRQSPASGHIQVEGVRLSLSGVPLDVDPLPLSAGGCAKTSSAIGLGDQFVVSWVSCGGSLVASSMMPDGSVRSPVSTIASFTESFAAAGDRTRALVVFDSAGTPRAQWLDLFGHSLDAGVVFTSWPALQRLPSLATIGPQSLVVWDNNGDIFGARVTEAGRQLDPSRILISRGGQQVFGTVATNGTEYFVVWLDFRAGGSAPTIRGSRISTQGVVLDDGGLQLTMESGAHMPRVASNGSGYLVTWGSGGNLLATRVSPAGLVLDTPALRHSRPVPFGETPSVASDGMDYLVVWSTSDADGGLDITGTRITAGGSILDPQGLTITNTPGFEVGPVLASNGDSYLVAWEENQRRPAQRYRFFPYVLAFENERILGTLLTRTGAVRDAGVLLLSPASGDRSSAAVGTNGTGYLVAWQDRRSGSSFDVYGARVTADGLLEDADGGFLISGNAQHEVLPAISSIGPGDYLLAYSQHAGWARTWRIKARVLDVNGPPVPARLARSTAEDVPLPLSLTATDPENEPLTFSIRRPPAHGTLSGTPPQLVYTPAPDFWGVDDFEFRVTDGTSTSKPGLVTITVTPANDAPVADDLVLSFAQGQPIAFTLPARDADGDSLQYRLVVQPPRGVLSGTPPTLTWQPPAGFRGEASLAFRVSDGVLDGTREGTVRWTVANAAPVVSAAATPAQPVEGDPLRFEATATDPGGDALELSWDFGDGATARGALVSHVYERPGRFRATVTASDGLARTSASLDVEVRNGAPRLRVSMPVATNEGAPIRLRAEVMDGQSEPARVEWDFGDGTPTVDGNDLTHVFEDDGRFQVTVVATDALGAQRRVERDVSVFNVSPTPTPQVPLRVRPGDAVQLTLSATDPGGARDPLTWTLLSGPGALAPDGTFSWTPGPTDTGRFTIATRVADDDDGAAVLRFDVDVSAPSVGGAGCGCGTGGAGVDVLLVVWALSRFRARSRNAR